MRLGEFAVLSAFLLTVAVAPAMGGPDAPRGGGPERVKAIVDHVADGDTIKVIIGGRAEYVRLIGIDTPEIYGEPECGGSQASAAMKRLLEPGDRVNLQRDRSQDDRDYYGRLLRYTFSRHRDLGQVLVRKGWARVYVYERAFQRLSAYRRAQRRARRARRGAWKLCGGFAGRS